MKKLILLIAAITISASVYSQKNTYEIDNGSIVVTKIVEGISADASTIYTRAMSYFARAYNDSNSVIQTEDRQNGLIIGKGFYSGLMVFGLGANNVGAYHTLRIDIKEGRARIICSAEQIEVDYGKGNAYDFEYTIVNFAPFADKAPIIGYSKGKAIDAFDMLLIRMHDSVEACADALQSGGVLNLESEDW